MTWIITTAQDNETWYFTGIWTLEGPRRRANISDLMCDARTFEREKDAVAYMRKHKLTEPGWPTPWTMRRVTLPEDAS